jgi:hypothetical protein
LFARAKNLNLMIHRRNIQVLNPLKQSQPLKDSSEISEFFKFFKRLSVLRFIYILKDLSKFYLSICCFSIGDLGLMSYVCSKYLNYANLCFKKSPIIFISGLFSDSNSAVFHNLFLNSYLLIKLSINMCLTTS